uniref:Uncharacterized protein n=1 Tax=Rhizophora mucronata TaxID=61149 RepID=A0A2P2QQ92_RHIMU
MNYLTDPSFDSCVSILLKILLYACNCLKKKKNQRLNDLNWYHIS